MGKRELLSATTTLKSEKWFRFRAMCFGRRYGGQDERVAVMAPSIKELRERVAVELAERRLDITYSYVDRILVHLYKEGPVESGLVRRGVLDATRFIREVKSSDTYKKILLKKINDIGQRAKEASNG